MPVNFKKQGLWMPADEMFPAAFKKSTKSIEHDCIQAINNYH